MVEIGYNIADCVGSGTIYGLNKFGLFFFLGGCLFGAISIIIIDYFKSRKVSQSEQNREDKK